MSKLHLCPNYEKAELFVPRKPSWCQADQTLDDAATLIAFSEYANAKSMLEIGSSAGEGAAALLYGNSNSGGHLFGLDLAETVYYNADKPIGAVVQEAFPEFAGRYTVVTGVRSNHVEALETTFDLVHIDANHSHPWGVFDFLEALPYLNQNALVCFHDANYLAPLSQAAYYFARLIKTSVFVKKHFAFVYEGPSDALYQAIVDCLEINWQTYLPPESVDHMSSKLGRVFKKWQAMNIASILLAKNAHYFKNESIYGPVNTSAWQREVMHRKVRAELESKTM